MEKDELVYLISIENLIVLKYEYKKKQENLCGVLSLLFYFHYIYIR